MSIDEASSYSGAARLLNERGVRPRNSSRGWWPSSVSVIVRRLRPMQPVRPSTRGVPAGGRDFVLARLLRCPTCGTLLTGSHDRDVRVRYACRLGSVRPHQRVSVTEHLILDAVKAEVAHLRAPDLVEAEEQDVARRVELEARRARVLDMFEAGHIDRADRERRLETIHDALSKLDARRVMLTVPEVDWRWPPQQLNTVLRALFDGIELDPATFQPRPDGFHWSVPEWRAA